MLSTYQRSRMLFTLAMSVCLLIVWFGSAWLAVPAVAGEAGSLIVQASPTMSFAAVGLLFLVCVVVASAIAGSLHFDAGLMCAAFGLSAVSMRGGPMRETLFVATGPDIYIKLAIELIVLFVFIAIGWLILLALAKTRLVAPETPVDLAEETPEPLDQRFLALLTHAVAMSILLMLLAQTDAKAQVLAAVGIASLLASLAAHQFVETRPSAWFWTGPLIVGLVGYIARYFNPVGWDAGLTRGALAGLARPQPLDYASFGVAGAIMGYWISRRWHRARALESTATTTSMT